MLSPQYADPPMYKPHTAAQRAGEQARHQDVKTETVQQTDGGRIVGAKKSVRGVDTGVCVD